jgi:hypothetical protein
MCPHIATVLVVIVRLYGAQLIDADVLLRAQSVVQAIFERSGVVVEWRRCPESLTVDGCATAPAPHEVAARLLRGPASVSADSCGVALVPHSGAGHFLSVFVDCVRTAADRMRVAESMLLGSVLAHEIGHLLLGTNSHGAIGLMQAQPRAIDWERASRGALAFTPDEGSRLRAALILRVAVAPRTASARDGS